jgi:hypothetical protein
MCRSIKQLRYGDHAPTDEEINAAALQFVRKVTGYRKPSRANQEAFEKAVIGITLTTRQLLENIGTEGGRAGSIARRPDRA